MIIILLFTIENGLLQTAVPINKQPNGSCKCLGRVSHGSDIWTPCIFRSSRWT